MARLRIDRFWIFIGKRCREKRQALGYTQDDIAVETGFSRTSIANFEAGRQRVPGDDLVRICRAVGTTLEAIACGY